MSDELSRSLRSAAHDFTGDSTREVIGAFWQVYQGMPRGLLESAYAGGLQLELARIRVAATREALIPVYYKGDVAGVYRADFRVGEGLILELKVLAHAGDAERRQLLHYLRATRTPLGLILNFGPRPQILRVVNGH
jgi:GxxExxY protein